MTSTTAKTVRQLEDADRERVAHMQVQAFVLPPERVAIAGNYPLEEGWVVEDEGTVQGALRVQRVGQYFGGRPVACAAVSSVKVAPEARGGGLGGTLLAGVLRALRDDGVAFSTLFPVHQGVYRRSGWETALSFRRRRLPLSEISVERSHASEGHRIEPWDDGDLVEIARAYEPLAARHNGLLSRPPAWWAERVLAASRGRVPYRYLARRGDVIVGYLVYTHEPTPEHHEYAFELACRDFCWRDPAAAAALLEFVKGHAGMGVSLSWIGPPEDPLELLLTGQPPKILKRLIAMGRLVHLPAAIEGRGYPRDLSGRLDLQVTDDVLEENAGPLAIELEGGEARAALGGGGGIAVDIRTLAALYTGWLDPATAASLGLLPGADAVAIETLRAAFGGPAPWMAEAF